MSPQISLCLAEKPTKYGSPRMVCQLGWFVLLGRFVLIVRTYEFVTLQGSICGSARSCIRTLYGAVNTFDLSWDLMTFCQFSKFSHDLKRLRWNLITFKLERGNGFSMYSPKDTISQITCCWVRVTSCVSMLAKSKGQEPKLSASNIMCSGSYMK